MFSPVNDLTINSRVLNNDLIKISNWAHRWKKSFNPDPKKQAVKVFFSRKQTPSVLPKLNIQYNAFVSSEESTKQLGLILDKRLSFNHHLKEKICISKKGIGLITRLRKYLPRKTLLCIYKVFVRPHLDYGYIIFDNPFNLSFVNKLESIQYKHGGIIPPWYKATLAITGCFRSTSRDKLYQELGLESLSDRRWARRLSFLYKILNGLATPYLYNLVPPLNTIFYKIRNRRLFKTLAVRTESFQGSFFPFCVSQWNTLQSCS